MSLTPSEEQPRVFNSEKDADKVAGVLEVMEENGWTYEVVVSPVSGRAVIAVFDENGDFLGNL